MDELKDNLITLFLMESDEPIGKINADIVNQRILTNFCNFAAETISLCHRITKEILVAQIDGSFRFNGHYIVKNYEIVGRKPTAAVSSTDWLTSTALNGRDGRARPPAPPNFRGTIPGVPQVGIPPPAVRAPNTRPKACTLSFQCGRLTAKGKITSLAVPEEINLMLTDDELNVPTINEKLSAEIHQIDGRQSNQPQCDYIVCTSRGASIKDSTATKEKSFWINKKHNSKILWALPRNSYNDYGQESSDADGSRCSSATLDEVHHEVKRVRLELLTTSPGFSDLLRIAKDEFSCTVCKEVIVEPVFCKTCKKIVTCKICFNCWWSSRNTCCLCRADGESVVEVLGMETLARKCAR